MTKIFDSNDNLILTISNRSLEARMVGAISYDISFKQITVPGCKACYVCMRDIPYESSLGFSCYFTYGMRVLVC
jgi:hypothetical protein